MKTLLENRKYTIVTIGSLMALTIAVFLANYTYYFIQEPQMIGGGIWNNLLSIPVNLLVALFMTKTAFLWNESKWKWISYPVFIVFLVALFLVLNPKLTFIGESYTTFLDIGPYTFSYLLLLLVLLIYLVPVGIDGIMAKGLKTEEVWISLGIFISTCLIAIGIKDLQGALWCGAFSTGYYLYKKKKVSLLPVSAAIIPVGYGAFLRLYGNTGIILFGRNNSNIIYT